jgi:hypothetical protein
MSRREFEGQVCVDGSCEKDLKNHSQFVSHSEVPKNCFSRQTISLDLTYNAFVLGIFLPCRGWPDDGNAYGDCGRGTVETCLLTNQTIPNSAKARKQNKSNPASVTHIVQQHLSNAFATPACLKIAQLRFCRLICYLRRTRSSANSIDQVRKASLYAKR